MLLLRWDSQPAFSGMDYANFSSLKRHIGTATDCLFSTYSFWGSTVKEKESASFTHSVWVRGLHSVCPSICCPLSTCGSKLAMPAYALWRQPLSFPPYQVTLLSALSFLQACNTEMYQPVFQFWSLHLCVCVCVVCLCSDVCACVHTGMCTHVWTWKPEISIECLLLLLSTFIFIYLCFLRQGFSLNLELTSCTQLAIQQTLRILWSIQPKC